MLLTLHKVAAPEHRKQSVELQRLSASGELGRYTELIRSERFVEAICRIANKQARWIG
jgi:hypothetical protein